MNYLDDEFVKFMAKLEHKGREVYDDFIKLSPQNQQRVAQTIQVMFGIDIVKVFFSNNNR